MKRISIILVSIVYTLPGVLAVLAHTHSLGTFEQGDAPVVTESEYAAVDTVPAQDGKFLVMLDASVKK